MDQIRVEVTRSYGKGGDECVALFKRLSKLNTEFESHSKGHTHKKDRREIKPLLIRALHAMDLADNPPTG